MPYSEKLFVCPGCQQAIFRRASSKSTPRCIECAIEYAAQAQLQIRYRTGEAYERWVAGMERAAREGRARAELDQVERLRRP